MPGTAQAFPKATTRLVHESEWGQVSKGDWAKEG